MKRFVALLMSVLMLISSLCLPVFAEKSFVDVPESKWCYDTVTKAVESGLFAGTSGNTFSPDEPMTRAMIVTVLAGIADADLSEYDRQVFSDVPAGKWYTAAISWASENDLVAGIGGGLFNPKANINRQEFCVMLYKFHKVLGSGLKQLYSDYPFDDADNISSWAESAVGYMRMCEVAVGRSENVFAPKATVSRAEAAAAFLKFTGDYSTDTTDTSTRVMGLSLSKKTSKIEPRKSETLTATLNPSDATVKTVRWTSSNPKVATVSANGKVTGVSEGNAVITATALDGGFSASCSYTVAEKRVESVWLNKTSSSLELGKSETLYAGVYPFDAVNINVSWHSSDPKVVEVNKYGVVTAKGEGSAVVTVRTADRGLIASCNYTVTAKHVQSIWLDKTTSTLETGKTETLYAGVYPFDAININVSWSSSNNNVVTVNKYGVVTAKAPGTAVVTVRTEDGGLTASCTYTVPVKHVQSVWLNKGTSELEKGKTETLYAGIYPYDASNINVTWSSSNPDVVDVNKYGVVTAKGAGTAVITVRTVDGGLTASCTYTVIYPRGIDPSKPMVALTFDDGPCKNTYRIVDILSSYGAVATFFEVGQNVKNFPDAVKYAADHGNEIGSHSYDHPNLQSLSHAAIRNQVNWTNSAIAQAIGYTPTLFRPPYGSRNSSVDNSVGMPMILWSVDTLDWKSRNANSVYNITMNNSRDGSIILMHSLYTTTADALEMILPALIEQGYQFVTVSELAEYRGYTLTGGNKYASLY